MATRITVRCPRCSFKGKFYGIDSDYAYFLCTNPDCGILMSVEFKDELEDLDPELLLFEGDDFDG